MSPRAGFFYVLGFLAMLGACLAVPRLLSFLPAVLGIAGVAWIKIKHGVFPAFDKKLAVFFFGIVVWGALSSCWAMDGSYTAERAIKIAGILLPALALFASSQSLPAQMPNKDRLAAIAVYVCALAGTILFFEYFSKFFLTRSVIGMRLEDMPEKMRNGFVINRSTVLLTAASLPAALLVWTSGLEKIKKNMLLCVLFVPVLACLCVTDSQTAQIAGALGILMAFFPSHRKKARRILMSVILVMMFAAPFLIKPSYEAFFANTDEIAKDSFIQRASIPHRLEVWDFATDKIFERPLFGHGMDSMRFIKADHVMKHMNSNTVMHPHNAVLQIWLEFGGAGIIAAMVFVFFLFQRIDALPALQQRYYMLLFLVMLSILTTGYGLWQAWLLGMLNAITAMSIMAVRINSKSLAD
jgi:O-antigen ligase